MMKIVPEFKIRIVYKSGHVQDFWCKSFSIKNGTWSWTSATKTNPILLGVDNIAAVWKLATRRRFTWGA